MARAAFWISLVFIGYVYVGYPLLLMALSRWARRPVNKRPWEPLVSLVIAVHNERDNIEGKIANCLEMDYPKEKLQLIISLDGPSDGTEFVVWKHADQGVEAVYCPVHKGKAAALNLAVPAATGEIVVFLDARQRVDRHAVRELVANLYDQSVGAVSGELVLLDERGEEAGDGVGLYWRYEKKLRSLESSIHSTLGATGAIYAIRRGFFKPLPEGTVLDDVAIPMRAVLNGKRAVFDPAARAYDHVASRPEAEYPRKVRTLMGNYQLLAALPELLLPWQNPVLVQFLSHKVGRLLVPYFMVSLFISNALLLEGVYFIFFVLQLAWYSSALMGFLISRSEARPASSGAIATTGRWRDTL